MEAMKLSEMSLPLLFANTIRVNGANMPDGCLVVDPALRPQSGSIIVAILDGEFTIKRLVKAGRNWVCTRKAHFINPS
ncbi:peptidase S24-like protein [Chitinophaga polysaccharea]|uniref:Peptidase S24-like protein n=1 Tax=Chitinophaga polysaccharea TaxID=1293035 RepID=A0A561PTG8_9BACT|nr:S24 family peptidase [Chitinophaga polysaccharea]TWF41410.1 peptidase S24-like protein [Chitinophaga polysaccharea]